MDLPGGGTCLPNVYLQAEFLKLGVVTMAGFKVEEGKGPLCQLMNSLYT